MSGPNLKGDEFINCLRLTEAEAAEVLMLLCRGDANNQGRKRRNNQGRDRRQQERLPYTHPAGLIIKMRHPGGSVGNYLVRARNLSSTGIGFLHGSFVYTGTHCTMALRTRHNRMVNVEGKVVRCHLVHRHIHEVGILFSEPIQLGDFVASALRMGTEVEGSKEFPQLSGSVMYVEDSTSDQELMTFHLANVGVKVKTVSNVLAAVELASQVKFDAVLANLWLPAMSGLELAAFLRQNAYKGPIIALTADNRPQVHEEASQHGCTTVLVKPYHFEELFAVLEPHLRHTQCKDVNETLASESWGDVRMQPLIRSFLNRLKVEMVEMQRQVDGGKPGLALRKLCLDVKGTAGGYGFPTISASAQMVLDLLLDGVEGRQLVSGFTELANLCRAACSLLEKEPIAAAAPSESAPTTPTGPTKTKAA